MTTTPVWFTGASRVWAGPSPRRPSPTVTASWRPRATPARWTTWPPPTRAHRLPRGARLAEMWGEDAGPDPSTAAPVVVEPASLAEPPLRLVGAASYDLVQQMDLARTEEYRAGEHLSRKAPG